jgi:hypothetical protein
MGGFEMWNLRPNAAAVMAGLAVLAAGPRPALAAEGAHSLCSPLMQEESLQLEEFELEVELARAEFAARVKIFEMIDQLWEKQVVERMVYLESRYNRDSTRLEFEAADLVARRQQALIERYRVGCGSNGSEAARPKSGGEDSPHARNYLEAHCESLSKRVEAAKIDLEFNRQYLENIRDLREGHVATATDVILAELDVEKDEIRIADASRRVRICQENSGGKTKNDPE